MPGRTSSWLFEQVHSHLVYLRDANCEIFSPNQFAAPAATIQTLVNGTICTRLPSKERWVQAYASDTEMCALRDLALNPSKINNKALAQVNHNYRGPLRQSLIVVENEMLILHELITGTSSFPHESYRWPPQCIPDLPSASIALLLAWDVFLCQTHVSSLSRLRVGQPYAWKIVRTCVQLPHRGAVSGHVFRCVLCW
jgi:hypothetical protein